MNAIVPNVIVQYLIATITIKIVFELTTGLKY